MQRSSSTILRAGGSAIESIGQRKRRGRATDLGNFFWDGGNFKQKPALGASAHRGKVSQSRYRGWGNGLGFKGVADERCRLSRRFSAAWHRTRLCRAQRLPHGAVELPR